MRFRTFALVLALSLPAATAQADTGFSAGVLGGIGYGLTPNIGNYVGFAWGAEGAYRLLEKLDLGILARTSPVGSSFAGGFTLTTSETLLAAFARYFLILDLYVSGEVGVGVGTTYQTLGSVSTPSSTVGFGMGLNVGYDFNIIAGLYLGPQVGYDFYLTTITPNSTLNMFYGLGTVKYRF